MTIHDHHPKRVADVIGDVHMSMLLALHKHVAGHLVPCAGYLPTYQGG